MKLVQVRTRETGEMLDYIIIRRKQGNGGLLDVSGEMLGTWIGPQTFLKLIW